MNRAQRSVGARVYPQRLLSFLALTFLPFLGACLNNAQYNPSTLRTDPSLNITGSSTGGLTSTAFTLSRVIRTNSDPSGSFDLIGDGSGTLGNACSAASSSTSTGIGGDSSSSGTGAGACHCRYNYTRVDGGSEIFDAPTTYVERDLIRCKTTLIPTDIPLVRVQVYNTASGTLSNEVIFRFSSSTSTLNLADPSSFVNPRRYQCKDVVNIPMTSLANVYDPFQSEDPEMSYPLNFYASNIAEAMSAFAAQPADNSSSWECPTNPSISSSGLDYVLYSVRSDGSSNKIFPPTGSLFDRSTFYLAKKSTGLMNIAVHAMAAPNIITQEPSGGTQTSGTVPPLGYGTAPIPSGNGERCPTSTEVQIPSGYRWVKLWQFRSTLETRKYYSSTGFDQVLVGCNPGKWSGITNSPNDWIFPDCGANKEDLSSIILGNNNLLADRILYQGSGSRCLKMEPTSSSDIVGAGATTDPTTLLQLSSPSYFSDFRTGTDVWKPRRTSTVSPDGKAFTAPLVCGSGRFIDIHGLCEPGRTDVPHDSAPKQNSLESSSRFDFVFVVSPTDVMLNQMKDPDNEVAKKYTPYRFIPADNCLSDPDNPNTGDCPINKKVPYGLKIHDLASNGDAPDNDPGRKPVFPVCVLQPISN